MIAILHGLEVGLSPMQALQRIAVVNGRPTIWGDGALALVQASGLAAFVSEVVSGDTPELWVASCTVLRRGEREVVTRTFSVEDAKRARLWGKAGPWSEYPQRMLQMRARAFTLRDAFADVLGGLYLHEELADCDETPAWQPIAAPAWGTGADAQHGTGAVQQGESHHARQEDPPARAAPLTATAMNPASGVRRTAPPPPWILSAGDGLVGSGSDSRTSSPTPSTGDRAADEPPTERAPDPSLPPLRPRSMDLRVRRPSPTASRRRFNEHWDVRRPRALGEGKARSIPVRSKPDPVVQDAGTGSPVQTEPNRPDEPSTLVPEFGQDDLNLLDDALCCALDPSTLDEIVAEFTARIEKLSSEDGRKAEAIIRRHAARVASLASGEDAQEHGHG